MHGRDGDTLSGPIHQQCLAARGTMREVTLTQGMYIDHRHTWCPEHHCKTTHLRSHTPTAGALQECCSSLCLVGRPVLISVWGFGASPKMHFVGWVRCRIATAPIPVRDIEGVYECRLGDRRDRSGYHRLGASTSQINSSFLLHFDLDRRRVSARAGVRLGAAESHGNVI